MDLAEELTRREIWVSQVLSSIPAITLIISNDLVKLEQEKNIAFIDKHNEEYKEGKHSYALAENRFADMVNKP